MPRASRSRATASCQWARPASHHTIAHNINQTLTNSIASIYSGGQAVRRENPIGNALLGGFSGLSSGLQVGLNIGKAIEFIREDDEE